LTKMVGSGWLGVDSHAGERCKLVSISYTCSKAKYIYIIVNMCFTLLYFYFLKTIPCD
jgi:hypothetical protein